MRRHVSGSRIRPRHSTPEDPRPRVPQPPHPRRALAAALLLASGSASAQSPVPSLPFFTGAGGDPQTAVAPSRTSDQVSVTNEGSIQTSLGPYGDPFGGRATLARFGVTYIGEGLGNVRGGCAGARSTAGASTSISTHSRAGAGRASTPTSSRSTGTGSRAGT